MGNGVEDVTPGHNITSPSKVLEKNIVFKNIERQVRKSCKQKLGLLSLIFSRRRWGVIGREKLVLRESMPQFLHPVRVLWKRRCRSFHLQSRRKSGAIDDGKPIRRAKFSLLSQE